LRTLLLLLVLLHRFKDLVSRLVLLEGLAMLHPISVRLV